MLDVNLGEVLSFLSDISFVPYSFLWDSHNVNVSPLSVVTVFDISFCIIIIIFTQFLFSLFSVFKFILHWREGTKKGSK